MNIIVLIILSPLIGFLFLSCKQGSISKKKISNIGIFSIFLPFFVTCIYGFEIIRNNHLIFTQQLWNWLSINQLKINLGFILDELSFSMLFVVTGVGLLIHIFSVWYMRKKEGYSRFFSYTNLFIASMSVLVLSDNFLFMYLGWEGVSVCSYLLIGFYYTNINNSYAAFKAFILTRISDVFLIIGIFLVYREFHSINFQEVKFLSHFLDAENFHNINYITFFLLMGVIGKSAQLPLQTWLSDAMVGPTPVSALIHAATMVTAGVYLISRTYFLFLLTPDILYFISLIGTFTILISSFSALVQTDIKRILAYSTMSQIGYMFLGLGVQAWSAVIIHLIIHAMFKALLFLSAGSLIQSCKNEKNIFKMGGLRKKLPFLYMNFIVGGASLASFPLLTAGFYSKGNILLSVLNSGHINLFFISFFCSFLTALYTFRMIFIVFHGKRVHSVDAFNQWEHNIPLFILLFFSTVFGWLVLPSLSFVFPVSHLLTNNKFIFEIICSISSISGIYLSYYFWVKNLHNINDFLKIKIVRYVHSFFLKGCGFDWIYSIVFINFYLFISKILSNDPFDKMINVFPKIISILNIFLLKGSSGYTRWYIASMLLGINLIFMLILLF